MSWLFNLGTRGPMGDITNKENEPRSPPTTPPWVKRRKVSSESDLTVFQTPSTSLSSPDKSIADLQKRFSSEVSPVSTSSSARENKHSHLVKLVR